MKDVNGTEIVIGDVVVVASRKGSSQWLTTKTVVGVKSLHMSRYNTNSMMYDYPILEGPEKETSKGKKYRISLPFRGSTNTIMVIGKATSVIDT